MKVNTALALLLSQIPASRTAVPGCAGVLRVLAYLLDSTGRTVEHAE